MKYKVITISPALVVTGSVVRFRENTIIELEPIEEVNTEQDDSWKVTFEDYKNSKLSYVDFCNSKLKPWVDKVRELEARNKVLNESAKYWEERVNKADRINEDLDDKYTALKEVADRMYKRMKTFSSGVYLYEIELSDYEKLTK